MKTFLGALVAAMALAFVTTGSAAEDIKCHREVGVLVGRYRWVKSEAKIQLTWDAPNMKTTCLRRKGVLVLVSEDQASDLAGTKPVRIRFVNPAVAPGPGDPPPDSDSFVDADQHGGAEHDLHKNEPAEAFTVARPSGRVRLGIVFLNAKGRWISPVITHSKGSRGGPEVVVDGDSGEHP